MRIFLRPVGNSTSNLLPYPFVNQLVSSVLKTGKSLIKFKYFLILFLYFFNTSDAKSTITPPGANCENNCFATKILSVEEEGDCFLYKLELSHNGECRYALSHFSVDLPCGTISDISNSRNFKVEVGTDPTTGLKGFKIDDISNFGEGSSAESFTVSFKLCPDDDACEESLNCWSPEVAYKAGTCVFYETIEADCNDLSGSLIPQDETCYGSGDGALVLSVEGGSPPYSYAWSDGSTAALLENLSAGTYEVKVVDANGKEIDLQATINSPDEITISGEVSHPDCSGKNGVIDLSVSGGSGPYTFSWSSGLETEDLSGISAGAHTVTVTDNMGCSKSAAFTLNAPASTIQVTGTVSAASCGQTNGSIELAIAGGQEPYSFKWTNQSTSQNLEALAVGSYQVSVTDANGCSTTKSFEIIENNTLNGYMIPATTGCVENFSGSINLVVYGGAEPYSYEWSHGPVSEDLDSLAAGNYAVTVSDANGCEINVSGVVRNERMFISGTSKSISCKGGNDGAINVNITNGTPPYTYEWSNGADSSSISGLSAGIYSLLVNDASGCSTYRTFYVTEPTGISVSYKVEANCNAGTGLFVDLSASGGSAPYTFLWSNGATTEDIESEVEGDLTVVVTDSKGCSWEENIAVYENLASPLSCSIAAPASQPEEGSEGNILLASSSEGVSYSWSISSDDSLWQITSATTSSSITYKAGGSGSPAVFTLTIVNSLGCTSTCTLTVTANAVVTDPDGPNTEDPGDPNTEDPGDPNTEEPGDPNTEEPGDPNTEEPGDPNTEEPGDPTTEDPGDEDPGDTDDGSDGDGDGDNSGGDDGSGTDDGTEDDGDGTDDGDADGPDDGSGDDGNDNGDGDGTGDEDPGDGDNDNGEDPDSNACNDCFNTEITTTSSGEGCVNYTMEVSHNGNCRYELSHFTVAVPCGKISNYSNSEGWAMELVQPDPTTGLSGLKVDDINGFGKSGSFNSFTVSFTVCTEDELCAEEIECWDPVVAYKSGTCVDYDTLSRICVEEPSMQSLNSSQETLQSYAYPNPFNEKATISFVVPEFSFVTIELLTLSGKNLGVIYEGNVEGGSVEKVSVVAGNLPNDLYIYKINSNKGSSFGKIYLSR